MLAKLVSFVHTVHILHMLSGRFHACVDLISRMLNGNRPMNNLQLARRTSVCCFKKLINLWAWVDISENRRPETGQVGRSGTDEYWKSVDLQLEKLVQDISSRFLWLELQKLVQVTSLLVWPSLQVWGWKRRTRNLLVLQVLIKVGFYIFSVQKRIFVF